MKTNRAVLYVFTAIILVACGTAKQSQNQQNQQYPDYGGYYPQQPPQGYQQYPPQQQPPQGYQQYPPQQQPQYQQQNTQPPQYQQQYQSQLGPDAAGFIEIKKSPIEELSLALGTNEIRAFGQAESGNEQMALNAARAQATAALQEKIEVYVRAGLDQYMQETGVNNEYALDESTRNQVQTAVKGIVSGAKVLDSRKLYNPNTKRYKYEVCVTYDRAGVLNAIAAQSERILRNEKQFEHDMQQAWDALDAQNNRITLGEQQQQRQNEMIQENRDREHQRVMEYQNQQNQYNLESQRIKNQSQQGEPEYL